MVNRARAADHWRGRRRRGGHFRRGAYYARAACANSSSPPPETWLQPYLQKHNPGYEDPSSSSYKSRLSYYVPRYALNHRPQSVNFRLTVLRRGYHRPSYTPYAHFIPHDPDCDGIPERGRTFGMDEEANDGASSNVFDTSDEGRKTNNQAQNQLSNPEEDWVFVCKLKDKDVQQISEVMVTTKDLMDMDLTFLDKEGPILTSKAKVCFRFLEEDCRKVYCKYRHCETPYLWEVGRGALWVPLEKMHNKELERAFCSPDTDTVKLTAYNPKTLPPASHPLTVILGQKYWEASFKKSRITSHGETLQIRRLSTPSSVVCDSKAATVWKWYFQESGGKYMEMKMTGGSNKTASQVLETYLLKGGCEETISINGRFYEVDLRQMKRKEMATDIETNMIRRPQYQDMDGVLWSFLNEHDTWIPYGSIYSRNNIAIEAAYQEDNMGNISFMMNDYYTYELDFSKMVQKNLEVGTVRQMKREVLGPRNYAKDQYLPNVPTTWEDMGDDLCKLVTLQNNSREYMKIEELFLSTVVKATITKIERVQNLTLWSNFVNQRMWMMKNNDNTKAVNEQRLFHGTKVEVARRICRENFNWRLAGTNVGHVYGRGVNFSNMASKCLNYSMQDDSGERVMLVARVLVGEITQGNSTMLLPSSKVPYDTTVNSVLSPSIFVKYHDNTMYPEYAIHFF